MSLRGSSTKLGRLKPGFVTRIVTRVSRTSAAERFAPTAQTGRAYLDRHVESIGSG